MFSESDLPAIHETIIRPSGLADYGDCARRAAASLFEADVKAAGFTLRQLAPHVGAAAGTASHKAVAQLLKQKRDGEPPAIADALALGIESFEKETADGVNWDQTTKHKDEALTQIAGIVKMYAARILPNIAPKYIEHRVRTPLGDDYFLQGTMDAYDHADIIHDLKTGTRDKNHTFQLGAYSLGLKESGETPRGARIDWLKRAKTPSDPVRDDYKLSTAETAAYAMAQRLKTEHQHFKQTGNEWSFAPNMSTVLCSDKYCKAWGTNFCSLWREKKEK